MTKHFTVDTACSDSHVGNCLNCEKFYSLVLLATPLDIITINCQICQDVISFFRIICYMIGSIDGRIGSIGGNISQL